MPAKPAGEWFGLKAKVTSRTPLGRQPPLVGPRDICHSGGGRRTAIGRFASTALTSRPAPCPAAQDGSASTSRAARSTAARRVSRADRKTEFHLTYSSRRPVSARGITSHVAAQVAVLEAALHRQTATQPDSAGGSRPSIGSQPPASKTSASSAPHCSHAPRMT